MSFDDTLGMLLIGEIFVAILFGATSAQVYLYYRRCKHDHSVMKCIISVLWFLDAAHLALMSHSIYHYTVTDFMNIWDIFRCSWSYSANMVIANVSQVIVTGVFAYRIWKFSGKVWPLLFILPPMVCNSAGSIAITVLVRKFPLYTDFEARFSWLWYFTFIAWTLCDCVIAVSLCAILARRRTGFRRTDSLLRTLILYTISTGALTSSVAIAVMIAYAVAPHNFAFIALSSMLPKLLLNSLLALLNSRESLRERIVAPLSIHLSKLDVNPGPMGVPPGDALIVGIRTWGLPSHPVELERL